MHQSGSPATAMSWDSTKRGEVPKRAVRRLRSVALVGSLARSWQQWANDNTHRQSSGPVGWQPSVDDQQNQPPDKKKSQQLLIEHSLKDQGQRPALLLATCKDLEEAEDLGVKIKTKDVTKSVDAKLHECGRDNVNALSSKYGLELVAGAQSLQDHRSPSRRRHCSSLVVELTRSWKKIEKENEPQPTPIDKSQSISSPDIDPEQGGQTAALRLERGTKSWKREKEAGDGDEDEVLPRIKRAGGLLSFREEIGKNKNLVARKKYNPLTSLKSQWQEWADHHQVKQKLNPFSEEFDHELAMATRLQKGDQGYGRPKEGTKTAERAQRAEAHIRREVMDMCFIIRSMGQPGADSRVRITFGELFERYVRISDKVVGILMRARKHGYVHFEGEMLWQGRDDDVIITLLEKL
ncbi:actin binding Rho activating protein b [Callorhinchus milii]|uniref:actin binding Rho activating protein b n=1 Tax=Callorhinchus milii TaxID=7868 RepID=UPI0004571911|nr:actin binding Rho activating protein b [Callorhinchus milii]|eukprot:gi/632969066/ref/XP_007900884.1/ PREDICTED: actin-binding Rho-activating protein [Callorhinchus milii]